MGFDLPPNDERFRVSMKALIRNAAGDTLFIKESGSDWILPGGGLIPGELPEQGLKRELREELGITDFRIVEIVGVESFYAEWRSTWVLWIIARVELRVGATLGCGVDVGDARYISASQLKPAADVSYELAKKWALAA